MTRITMSLPDELADRLRLEAERRRTSVSEVMRTLVADALGHSPEARRRIPFAGIFDDPEMTPANRIEEELEESWADALDRDRG